jgi:hypothetical protein
MSLINEEEKWKQYDRFILQLREEVRELYLLYSFFFTIESALFFVFLNNELKLTPNGLFITYGLIVSIIWLVVCTKQRMHRDKWIKKIKKLESDINIDYQMFSDPCELHNTKKEHGIAIFMSLLPVLFIIFWVIKLFLLL